MDLNPQLPPLPTLTLKSTQLKTPPEKPPDPSISMLFPENTQYRVPDNPFRGELPKMRNREHKEALEDALVGIRAPFLFSTESPIEFNGANVGIDMSTETFNAAMTTVIAAIERGYHPTRDPTPLGASEWARLSCAMLAAVGRGYHRQYSIEKEGTLDKIRAETIDPNPLPKNPTLFHRLAAIADDIGTHVGVDQDGYQDWYHIQKEEFNRKATKAAAAEVDEKWLSWKAKNLDMLAQQSEKEITAQARKNGIDYFIATGQRLGLHITRDTAITSTFQPPTTGKKRTASGSLPGQGSVPTEMRKALSAESHEMSPIVPCEKTTPPESGKGDTLNLDTIMTVIKAAIGLAIQSAMAPYAAKITALEKATTPVPNGNVNPITAQEFPTHRGIETSAWATADPGQSTNTQGEDFIPVMRNERGKKAKNKVSTNVPALAKAQKAIPAPVSYAGIAATQADITKKNPSPSKQLAHVPTITEVTVLRAGGFLDTNLEQRVRARAADAIVREVTLKMAKTVARPVPLKAGRWSIHPRSKGNFVYSFDGNVPFDIISTYEHILLAPFGGSGKLSPSMGWTRLLAHGVPVWDDIEWKTFGPEDLLQGVKAIPSLKKAHFAMPPRWLKPVDSIESNYSTITFAISDPDGTIANKLLTGRAALFGKEVVIQRWVDKPALVQCSHCHALGHIRSSRGCPLARDSVRCHICGGAHTSDKHDQCCPRKHTVAGICDCKHYKCLNCHKTGHDCRNTRCPARDLFRPRQSRGPRKSKGKGKEREHLTADEPADPTNITAALPNSTIEHILDEDGDLYDPPPLPPNPTGPQIRTALHDRAIANICNHQSMEVDAGNNNAWSYNTDEFPEAINEGPSKPAEVTRTAMQSADYSPSRPQLGDAQTNLA